MKTTKISPETLADAVMTGLRKDQDEIRIGQTRFLYVLSRLAPGFAEPILQKA